MPKNIISKEALLERINYIHFSCYKLCKQSFGTYLKNSGNVSVFCHSLTEYIFLTDLRKEMAESSINPNQKHFRLLEPIVIKATEELPETLYEFLYIRKPDLSDYGKYMGDIDFYVDESKLNELIGLIQKNEISGAQLYEQPGVGTMIQLSNSSSDVVAYVSTKKMTEGVRVKH